MSRVRLLHFLSNLTPFSQFTLTYLNLYFSLALFAPALSFLCSRQLYAPPPPPHFAFSYLATCNTMVIGLFLRHGDFLTQLPPIRSLALCIQSRGFSNLPSEFQNVSFLIAKLENLNEIIWQKTVSRTQRTRQFRLWNFFHTILQHR